MTSVTNSSGTALVINTYDEYGIPRSSNSGRFQYTGQAWLPELGLYYYKARIYSPTLGRFLQPDPIGYGAGMNRYAYVGGNPVNLVDPLGLRACGADEVMVVPGHVNQGGVPNPGGDGFTVTGPPHYCVSPDWLKQQPDVQGAVYGPPVYHAGDPAPPQAQKTAPQKDTSITHCAAVAAWAHKGQIAVDALSGVPVGKFAALAGRSLSATTRFSVSAVQLHGSFGSGLLSALNGDLNGAGLGAAGYGTVIADAFKEGGSFIPGVGALIAAASIANDVFGSEEYKTCRKGE